MTRQKETDNFDFIRVLADDVQHALNLARGSNEQADRRNLIRAIISATEGISWDCRNYVRSILREVGQIPPFLDMAFDELTYSVTERGRLIPQPRYISITAMIRLIIDIATMFCPDLKVNFGDGGWEALKRAIAIRNRITHPKNLEDLTISDADVETAQSGFFWFIAVSGDVMEAMTLKLRLDVDFLRQFMNRFEAGDPETVALYQSIIADTLD